MKAIKKVFATLLAVVMALGLSVTALASEPTNEDCVVIFPGGSAITTFSEGDENSNFNITSNGTTDSTRTWSGYQLLTLTVSVKEGDTCEENGNEHTSTCYNYAYYVNAKYRNILQEQVYTLAGNNFWTDKTKPENKSDLSAITDQVIIQYLESLTDDSDAVRTFADTVYRAIKSNQDLTADVTTNEGLASIEQGYWLFADTTNESNQNTANSLVLLDTKGEQALTIEEKVEFPTVEKEVSKDEETYGTSTDVNVGDTVYFQITGTLPSNLSSYETYQYIFHDTLSSGLTLNTSSVTVTYYSNDENTNGTVVTGHFTVTTTTDADTGETTLTISCENIKWESAPDYTSAGSFVVTYTATLNEKALETGEETNKVNLEYSNNPYDTGTGKTPDETVEVYTFTIVIDKYANNSEDEKDTSTKLSGASFVLYKTVTENSEGKNLYYKYTEADSSTDTAAKVEWVEDQNDATVKTTNVDGAASFPGLEIGTYYLLETAAPDGYNLLNGPVEVTVGSPVSEKDNYKETAEKLAAASFIRTVEVPNSTGAELPSTGGMGTTIFYVVGSILVVGAAVLLIVKKRMNGTER